MLFKILQYLYLLSCVSPDLTVRLLKMQNNVGKSVQLVDVVITCGCHIIGALICGLLYLFHLIILLLFMIGHAGRKYWVLGLSQMQSDWLKVTCLFSRQFSHCCQSHIFWVFVNKQMWCTIIPTGHTSCHCFPEMYF